MSHSRIRDNFEMKVVTEEHITEYNELLRYVFQVTNEELQKSGYEDGELIRSKRPILQKANVWGWFTKKEGKLISQICTYPCEVNIHGRTFQMGGLTGVGTYPEYAGLGLMQELIYKALDEMRLKGQYISYLYPYSIPYYRGKGWDILSDHMTFKIKDTQIPVHVDVGGYVERRPFDHAHVKECYDLFARQTHGALIRSELDWEEYWRWENEDERIAAVYYNDKDEHTGCMIYWIEDDIFHFKEMFYLNLEARHGLWNFIRAHYSMIDEVHGNIYTNEPLAFFLEDSQIVESIEPYFMARIVDVEEFLKSYPFASYYEPMHFIVEDPVMPRNNGVFSIVGINSDGSNQVSRSPAGKAIKLNVRTLTSMLMNYRTPVYYATLGQVVTDEATLRLLRNMLFSQQPYFSDYF